MGKFLFNTTIVLLAAMMFSAKSRAQCSGNQLTTSTTNLASQYGQYITADCTGNLINFNYQVETGGSAVTMTVRGGTGCSGEVLRTISYTEGLFNSVNFSPGIAVTGGQTYSVIIANASQINIKVNTNSGYQTGGLLMGSTCQTYPAANSWDMVFSYAIVAALPVELAGFSAKRDGENVRLLWETASEHNNRGFEVQRSGDGENFQAIGFEKGNGTTAAAHTYSFLDEKPLPGLNFYRLRQLDLDGKEDFSAINTVELAGSGPAFSAFPNPVADGRLNLFFREMMDGESVSVRIFDLAGRLVKTSDFKQETEPLLDLGSLPPGIYSLEAAGEGLRFFEKIIVR